MAGTIVEERRVQSRSIIESLINSRTETLTQYKDIMTYKPFEMNDTLQEVLEDFCESMVDYTAKAHFNLYNYIEEDQERRQSMLEVAGGIYPELVDNTQKILDFNDMYNSDVAAMQCDKLEYCLNSVGELLADRINIEDDIINAILSVDNA
ncbi:MAG: sigma D regulator [gamma proteobacterium symbiont of Bathyaustriella thionipta]|nr:sigma D regulator [gamma proteobacterium symbiont of Bathyaustriella thionipta]MCU7951445.1 sigma D regulator [gamma proteobacterium symbiont of Bathyaustriella thionipta]MCU7952511.1 sigma D regulator [gamma proteobacterium symbiont of Bathyaustriella thionipta]MCU7958016.1 sigma D regulator [gamma proteobacterium symbiont of Bathyaustriella thionipta]MCU7966396.1 sigma D regulator [gamma proteobacterium symbiont of Bathyaustriella thionipta]